MIKVTEQMKQEISKRYPFEFGPIIAKDLSISVHTLNRWAVKLGLKKDVSYRNPQKISLRDENLIRELYPTKGADYVGKLLNKKPHAVSELARRLGVKCEVELSRKGDLSPLFNGSIQSFYWLGFIAADGYVSKDGHLLISQVEKDKETLDHMAEYLSTEVKIVEHKGGFKAGGRIAYRIGIKDLVLGRKIYDLFQIPLGQKKTYTPISVSFMKTQEQAMAFLCGFIDGDGSRYTNNFKIECDLSQLEMFKNLMNLIPQYKGFLLKETYKKQQNKTFCLFSTNKELCNALIYFSKQHRLGSTRKFYF